jgi:hypothetical protein
MACLLTLCSITRQRRCLISTQLSKSHFVCFHHSESLCRAMHQLRVYKYQAIIFLLAQKFVDLSRSFTISVANVRQIGMNAMVTQYDKSVFGDDAHEFRPERWLESEERYWAMDKNMLVFGAGTRTCIGKHAGFFHVGVRYKVLIMSSFLMPKCTRWYQNSFVGLPSKWHMMSLGKRITRLLCCRAMLFVR